MWIIIIINEKFLSKAYFNYKITHKYVYFITKN